MLACEKQGGTGDAVLVSAMVPLGASLPSPPCYSYQQVVFGQFRTGIATAPGPRSRDFTSRIRCKLKICIPHAARNRETDADTTPFPSHGG
jgi:hypothetical protein